MTDSVPDRPFARSTIIHGRRLLLSHRPLYNTIFDACYTHLKDMDTPQQPQLRRRPKPPYTYCPTTSPTVSSSSMYTANAQQVMPPLPYKTIIRPVGLQSDTGATPQRLRDLENEWKDRRKKALADISNGNRGDNNQQQYGPRQSSVIDRQSGPSLKLAKNRPSSFTGAGDIRLSQSKFTAAQPNLVRCIGPPTPPDTPSTSITPLKLDQVARDTAPSVNRPLELSKLLAAKYETEVIPNRKTRIRTLLNALPILASPLPTTAGPVPLIRPHRGTIHVLPSKCSELDIFLTHDELLRVISGGMELIWIRETRHGASSFRKHLKLRESAKWTDEEVNLWYRVQMTVENLKRKTPQVGPRLRDTT